MNILVVEDNRVQSRIVKRCLDQRRRGDFVKVIPDAEEALKLLRDDAMRSSLTVGVNGEKAFRPPRVAILLVFPRLRLDS